MTLPSRAASPGDVAATFCATLVDEWALHGAVAAVISPGSRSTPMALALAADRRISLEVRLDERSAAFFALGIALESSRPAILLTTSGTAAVGAHAAVVEAFYAKVPLLVCTADRPPELQRVGAPQTIDQNRLFGEHVGFFFDPGVPDAAAAPTWRSLASRAFLEATSGPRGPSPVHLNLPFREPLVGEAGELPARRGGGRPWHAVRRPEAVDSKVLSFLGAELRAGRRGVIVAGGPFEAPGSEPGASSQGSPEEPSAGGTGSLLCELARRLSWPILGEPRARLAGGAGEPVVGASDTLLRGVAFAEAMAPEVVLRLGAPHCSKVLGDWLARSASGGALHIGLDPSWAWRDPSRDVAEVVAAAPGAVLRALVDATEAAGTPSPWLQSWVRAEEAAQAAIDAFLRSRSAVSEPAVARRLYGEAEGLSSIVVSSSMPVRDLESFGRPRQAPPRVIANRGANGIDGVLSTLLGVAWSSGSGRSAGSAQPAPPARSAPPARPVPPARPAQPAPTYGLLGDLAVLHDASALVRPRASDHRGRAAAVVTVLDNGGGGIFSFLPQAAALSADRFEELFGTPQEPRVADLLRGSGLCCEEIDEMDAFVPALRRLGRGAAEGGAGPFFVVARTDRQENVRIHAELQAAVVSAVSSLPA